MSLKTRHLLLWGCLLLGACGALMGQTFELNNQNANSQHAPAKKKKGKAPAQTPNNQPPNPQPPSEEGQTPANGIGWGSGIDVAREARTAQQALAKGDYKAATTSAMHA